MWNIPSDHVFNTLTTCFSFSRVFEHNYNEVDNLTLDHNHFTSLPEKLLDMKLSIGFSVADNKLTSISYDLANR